MKKIPESGEMDVVSKTWSFSVTILFGVLLGRVPSTTVFGRRPPETEDGYSLLGRICSLRRPDGGFHNRSLLLACLPSQERIDVDGGMFHGPGGRDLGVLNWP
jgi:hypothetical protein